MPSNIWPAWRHVPSALLASEHRHGSVTRALRLLGLGAGCLEPLRTAANPTEALTTFRKRGGSGFSLIGIAMAEHSLGHVKESQHALDESIAKHAQDSAYGIAQVYGWRGDKDNSFAWLERAFQQRDGGLPDVKDDVLLTSLRGDDRFGAMLKKMQLPE